MNLSNPYAIPSLISSTAFIILMVYVIKKNSKHPANRVTALMFFALVLWSLGESLERFTGPGPVALQAAWDSWIQTNTAPPPLDWNDYGRALFAGKFLSAGVELLAPATLHFSLTVPRRRKVPKWLYPLIYGFAAVNIGILFSTDFYIHSMEPYYAGWGIHYGAGMLIHFAFVLVLVMCGIVILFLNFIQAKNQIEKNQVKIVLMGMVFCVGWTIPFGVVPSMLNWSMYPLTMFALIIMAMFMAYAIGKYKLFVIEAVTEEMTDAIEKVDIKPGLSYMFKGRDKSMPYMAFRNLVSEYPGLCLTIDHPRKVRKRYHLEKIPIIWLSTVTSEEKTVDPYRLDFEIDYTLHSFMQENRDTVVIVDGFSYLASANGQQKTMEFLKTINDVAASTNSTLIMAVDDETLDEKSISMLAGTFDESVQSSKAGSVGTIDNFNKLIVKQEAFECFSQVSQRDPAHAALCISKTFPKKLASAHGLEDVDMIWLSNTDGERTVSPNRMEFELMSGILDFYKKNPGGIMVLDGLSTLLMENGMERTLDFVKSICDITSNHKGTLLVPMRPGEVEQEQLAIFATLFDYLESDTTA
jgi:archaellum biogenesis ATPase FlaH